MRSLRKQEVPPEKYAYCEPNWASATSKWHIREVGSEGLKLGGGIPPDALGLCGTDVIVKGWDRCEVRTEDHLVRMTLSETNPLCMDCAVEYRLRTRT